MNPDQKLNLVLQYLKHRGGIVSIIDIIATLVGHGIETTLELRQILQELITEKYVAEEGTYPIDDVNSIQQFTLTFKGEKFIDQNGYVQQTANNLLHQRKIHDLEYFQKVQSKVLVVLTALIAFGTLIAAVYYSMEIWRFYHC